MEVICVPPTAATDKIHLGNLYNWILIDSYKRAKRLLGENVVAYESWNCYSQRLEEKVLLENQHYSLKKLKRECSVKINQNIENAHNILDRFAIELEKPPIRDDSEEYQNFIQEEFVRRKGKKEITSDLFLVMPNKQEVLKRAEIIEWTPSTIWKRFYGASTLDKIYKIPVFRRGSYGIPILGFEGVVFGQRFVQSLLPHFYRKRGLSINLGIFGNDVLIKWIYFMLANASDFVPFERIGLSGLVLGKSRKKLSKYDYGITLVQDMKEHPDNIRLGLLKQSFGSDFNYPDFSLEERVRRKAHHCLVFLENHAKPGNMVIEGILHELEKDSRTICKDITKLNFSTAYKKFRRLVYEDISKKWIEQIKLRGIAQDNLDKLVSKLTSLFEIFIPKTLESHLKKR